MQAIKIHIIIDDCFYAYGLQEYLFLFFQSRGVDTFFWFGEETRICDVPDITIRHFIPGEIYTCQSNLNFNDDNIILGITDQKYVQRDLPNCLKGMKVIGYNSTLEELDKALEYIISIKMKCALGTNFFKVIGCYNCQKKELSAQEIKIVKSLLSGESSGEIVKKLEISLKTFYAHKYNISRKFGLRGDNEFVQIIRKLTILSENNEEFHCAVSNSK